MTSEINFQTVSFIFFDILQLITVFKSLTDDGNTVLFIEHNNTLNQSTDQVITLGPGSEENGGVVVV